LQAQTLEDKPVAKQKRAKVSAQDRKPVAQQDNMIRSTESIYGSGNPSVIQRSIADSTLKHKDKLKPNITPNEVLPRGQRPDPGQLRSSDVYYGNQEGKTAKPNAVDLNQMQSLPPQGSTLNPVMHNQTTHPVEIKTEAEIAVKVAEGVQAIKNGTGKVQMLLWDKLWADKIRTQIDFAVAREELTEDQGRDFQFSVHESALGMNIVDTVAAPEITPAEEVTKASQLNTPVEELKPKDAPVEDDGDEIDEMLGRAVESNRPVAEVEAEQAAAAVPQDEVEEIVNGDEWTGEDPDDSDE
jgi:hypothetical protein